MVGDLYSIWFAGLLIRSIFDLYTHFQIYHHAVHALCSQAIGSTTQPLIVSSSQNLIVCSLAYVVLTQGYCPPNVTVEVQQGRLLVE